MVRRSTPSFSPHTRGPGFPGTVDFVRDSRTRRQGARLTLQPSRDGRDYAFTHRVRTRFAETDAMGVVHHAAYLPYLEEARVAYLRSIGHPYDAVRAGTDTDGDSGGGGRGGDRGGDPGRVRGGDGSADNGREFPVVEIWVRYHRPLRFDEVVDVSLAVGETSRATFQIAYLLTVGGEERATAVTVHGCLDRRGRPVGLPVWIRPSRPPEAVPSGSTAAPPT